MGRPERRRRGRTRPAINLVWLYIELGLKPAAVESHKNYLDQAARAAPDDDRVWLGQANLAIQAGRYDEAKRWLEACTRRPAEGCRCLAGAPELGYRDEPPRGRRASSDAPSGR